MVYDWENKEEICYRMYIEEKKSLEEIMDYMKDHHKFTPRYVSAAGSAAPSYLAVLSTPRPHPSRRPYLFFGLFDTASELAADLITLQ